MKNDWDFSGYATRAGVKCSDGRIIDPKAFIHQNGNKIPLLYMHQHDTVENVLGHAYLEARKDGMYTYAKFNDTPAGQQAKEMVRNGDIEALSIFANQLQQNGPLVEHGQIKEVSLVLSGANPGAYIENLSFAHADGTTNTSESEAIIYMNDGLSLRHDDELTVEDVLETLDEDQQEAVAMLIESLLEEDEDDYEDDYEDDELDHYNMYGGNYMKHNAFEGNMPSGFHYAGGYEDVLTHDDMQEIFADAARDGSLRDAVLAHAGTYGIDDIDFLFPDYQNLDVPPSFISREMGWVAPFLGAVHHTPFTRIKSMHADITDEEARAKGYMKGNLKKDEVFSLLKRVTGPVTIYKKQKLDRDDVIDITSFDVVAWIKAEMRIMLDEEIARAILIGDGRAANSDDKIKDPSGTGDGFGVRSMYNDAELYAPRVSVAADITIPNLIDSIIKSRKEYKGSGNPTLFTTEDLLTDMLLVKDTTGRRLYDTEASLASALRVSQIVAVEPMETLPVKNGKKLLGIIVNPKDYNVGADKGGAVSMFDDFDIDYNQMKFLMETRISGALTRVKSAVILEQAV